MKTLAIVVALLLTAVCAWGGPGDYYVGSDGDIYGYNINVRDTGLDHYLKIRSNENLTANRTLHIVTGDVDVSLSFPVPAALGGTGAATYPAGEILFGNTTSPLLSDPRFKWDAATDTLSILDSDSHSLTFTADKITSSTGTLELATKYLTISQDPLSYVGIGGVAADDAALGVYSRVDGASAQYGILLWPYFGYFAQPALNTATALHSWPSLGDGTVLDTLYHIHLLPPSVAGTVSKVYGMLIEYMMGSDNGYQLAFKDASSTYETRFRTGTQAADFTYILPNSGGTSGQALVTDGGDPQVLSWATVAGVGGTGITSLGGLEVSTQTFVNDTNVTMTSAGSTHTLGWTGQLSVARGGTGAGTHTGLLVGNDTSAMTSITPAASRGSIAFVTGGSPAWGKLAAGTQHHLLKMGPDGEPLYGTVHRITQLYVGGLATAPTAKLHLAAGTASASTAPLKLTAGTDLTTPEAGAFEYDGTNLYFTPAATRMTVQLSPATALTLEVNASGYATLADAIAATPTGGTLYIPAGTWVITSPISITDIRIRGDGYSTIIDGTGLAANEDAIYVNPTVDFKYSVRISDLYINMNGSGRDGIRFTSGDFPTIHNVYIYKPGQDGVHCEPVLNTHWLENLNFSNVHVEYPGRHGFSFITPNLAQPFINVGTFTNLETRGVAGAGKYPVYFSILYSNSASGTSVGGFNFIGCEFGTYNATDVGASAVYFNAAGTAYPNFMTFVGCTFEDLASAQTAYAIAGNKAGAGNRVILHNPVYWHYDSGDISPYITNSDTQVGATHSLVTVDHPSYYGTVSLINPATYETILQSDTHIYNHTTAANGVWIFGTGGVFGSAFSGLATEKYRLTTDGVPKSAGLTGSGNGYLCVNSVGLFYRSATACVP